MIEGQQPLVGERLKKLKHEERIAGGLRVHQLRERRGVLKLAAEESRQLAARRVPDKRPSLISTTFVPQLRMAVSFRISGWAASTSLSR